MTTLNCEKVETFLYTTCNGDVKEFGTETNVSYNIYEKSMCWNEYPYKVYWHECATREYTEK